MDKTGGPAFPCVEKTTPIKCYACGGNGKVSYGMHPFQDGTSVAQEIPCGCCAGSGYVIEPTYHCGLSILDYFAGQALMGIIAGLPKEADYSKEVTAEVAYDHASAMLAERERRNNAT